jgi:hypothetical protein
MEKKIDFAALCGVSAVGFALQLWFQRTAYEPDTNLVLPGAPAATALIAFAIAVPLLTLLSNLWCHRHRPLGDGSLYALPGRLPRVFGMMAGLLVGLGSVLLLSAETQTLMEDRTVLNGVCVAVTVLMAFSGLAMLWLTLRTKAVRNSLAALIPGFAICFRLVFYYHDQSKDPVVFHYAFTLLTLLTGALACYHHAAYCFARPRPKQARLFTLVAGCYAFTALPAAQSLGDALVLTGLGCWMLQHSLTLPMLPRVEVTPPATEFSTEGSAKPAQS